MTAAELPIGPPVDPTPAQNPAGIPLEGHYGSLERLDPLRHGADLWNAVKGANAIWTYMNYGPFADARAFGAWLEAHAATQDPFAYVILSPERRAVGIATYLEIRPAMRVIEVGHILYPPALQRTPLGTEAQYLLARHAFEDLRYRRYEWKCDALNAPSRRAAERYGFTFEGVFRQHMIRRGHNRDTAWFSMLDGEWTARKAGFERWLDPQNFASDGRQKSKLNAGGK